MTRLASCSKSRVRNPQPVAVPCIRRPKRRAPPFPLLFLTPNTPSPPQPTDTTPNICTLQGPKSPLHSTLSHLHAVSRAVKYSTYSAYITLSTSSCHEQTRKGRVRVTYARRPLSSFLTPVGISTPLKPSFYLVLFHPQNGARLEQFAPVVVRRGRGEGGGGKGSVDRTAALAHFISMHDERDWSWKMVVFPLVNHPTNCQLMPPSPPQRCH